MQQHGFRIYVYYSVFQQKGNAKGIPKLILDNNVIGDRPGKKKNDSPPFTEKKHKSIREGKYTRGK